MNFKNIFLIMIVLFITLGLSTVSAESISDDNTAIELANSDVSVETQDVSLDMSNKQIINNGLAVSDSDSNTDNATGNGTSIKPTEIVANDVVFKIGDDKSYSVILLSNGTPVANQTINFFVNNEFKSTSTTNANGTATLDMTFLDVGVYVIDIKYNATSKYNASTAQAVIKVFNTIVGNDLIMYYRNGSAYIATLYNSSGNPITNQKVSIVINGVAYNRTTNANGTIKFDIKLNPGTYNVKVTNPVTKEVLNNTVTVLSVINANDTTLYFRNGTGYVATFVDGNGRPLNGTKVQFNINGVFYNRTTNVNGTTTMAINLAPGKYIITAINPVNEAAISNNVTVLPVIEGKDVTLYFRNGTSYIAKFLDGKGNPLNGTKVQFNINGVFYNRTTNVNGSAKIIINLAPGKYKITAINPLNNAMYSNNVTVLSTISASNFKTTYQTGGRFNFTILDQQGHPIANQNVTLNINGVFYSRTTNANGSSSLAINLRPATYICTVTANGLSQSYNITVDKRTPEISYVSTKIKQNDPVQCKITYNKQPVEGAGIFFMVDTSEGQKYAYSFSNAEGIATVQLIGFAPGSYQIYAGTQDDPLYSNLMQGTSITIV